MPHLFSNRTRQFNIFSKKSSKNESVFNAILYLLGGLAFVIGSIFFFPRYNQNPNIGPWIFFGGSLLYLAVNINDLSEVFSYLRNNKNTDSKECLELFAALIYFSGTMLFIIGSLFFLKEFSMIKEGSWCFIWGSLLFFIGTLINTVQITYDGSLSNLHLMIGIVVCFAVGSTIFLVASVPYLWNNTSSFQQKLFNYLASEYLVGSVLFFIGGALNYYQLQTNNK